MPPHSEPNSAAARPEELAFLRDAAENPGDDAPLQILADWLEEHDDPRRGELLRLHLALRATCCEPRRRGRADQQKRLVELLGQGVRPAVPRRTVTLGESVAMTFAWVPPGTFLMGSPRREKERRADEVQHRVTLPEALWIGVTPMTQAQWRTVMGSNPMYSSQGDDHPAAWISWEDCRDFCKKLGQRAGQRFRLPSEAEWEYACRAGTTTPFFVGATLSTEQANFDGNFTYGRSRKGTYREQTTAVGSFPPNAWGLHDMHGDVWEWCQDRYRPYPGGSLRDLQGELNASAHVLRGGTWYGDPGRCRSARRYGYVPRGRSDDFGCRMVLCLD